MDKQQQVERMFRVYRDPERLRDVLRLRTPASREESEKGRYGRCPVLGCSAHGTESSPLDLHHIIPRSHSVARKDDYTNHLYLCGDFFPKNHHKALHGEATLGYRDWKHLGVFDALLPSEEPSQNQQLPPATTDQVEAVLQLVRTDPLASALFLSNPSLVVEYGSKNGYLPFLFTLGKNDLERIYSFYREKDEWNPLKRLLKPKMPLGSG